MPDPITLGALAIGIFFLALWYGADRQRRDDGARRIVGRLITMPGDDSRDGTGGLPAVLVRDLPQHLDERWVERRVLQNVELFRATTGLLEAFLFNLRDRYRSQWELEMLTRVEAKLEAQVRVMEKGAHHAAVRRTLYERTETEIFETRTKHFEAKETHEKAQRRSAHSQHTAELEAEHDRLEAENKVLEARLRQQQLRRKLGDAEQTRGEKRSDEDTAYDRGRRRQRTERAEQKGALDEDLEFEERMRRERDERIAAINADDALSDEEKTKRINRVRSEYAKIFAREY